MKWSVVIACALSYGYLSFLHTRSDFYSFLCVLIALAGCLYYFFRERSNFSLKEIFLLALGFRLLFIAHTPALSNDYFRFLWDGMIVNHGENPYVQTPDNYPYFYSTQTIESENSGVAYYAGMNSRQYYSPYPAVCQYIWGLSEGLFPTILSKIIVLRFIVMLFEIATILLVYKTLKLLKKDASLMAMYALNPLVILEFTGNLHPEVFMLAFMAFALYLYALKKPTWSGVAFGLAIAAKFLPLIVLPFLITKIGFRRAFIFGLIALVSVILVFLPFYDPIIMQNIRESVGLYFGQFYFNASVFYVVKELSDWLYARDLRFDIAPILSMISAAFILFLAFYKKEGKQFFERLLLALSLYFLFATTVHPWYIGVVVLAGVFTSYTFPFAWSVLVLLSYAHYTGGEMREHYVWIVLEYALLVGWMAVEFKRFNPFRVVVSAEP